MLFTRLLKVKLMIFSSPLESTKNDTLHPLAQIGCSHLL